MTSIATMLGALPIALALGAGSASRVSMGIVVIGGLLFSLVLTLFVIPAVYSYLSREKNMLRKFIYILLFLPVGAMAQEKLSL